MHGDKLRITWILANDKAFVRNGPSENSSNLDSCNKILEPDYLLEQFTRHVIINFCFSAVFL